jgi:hypothetical protein
MGKKIFLPTNLLANPLRIGGVVSRENGDRRMIFEVLVGFISVVFVLLANRTVRYANSSFH